MYVLHIAEKTDENFVLTDTDAKEVDESETTQAVPEETPEINEPQTEELPSESCEQPPEETAEKDGFRELTIEDLDAQPSTATTYSDSDDELEMLMNRSIGDILSKHKKEESDE